MPVSVVATPTRVDEQERQSSELIAVQVEAVLRLRY
jgi:hypothetical protein